MKKLALLFFFSFTLTAAEESIPLYFCTAADSAYYKALVNLIGSIHRVNYENTAAIAVFDLGLAPAEIQHLNKIKNVTVYKVEKTHPQIITPIQTHRGKKTPGSYAWKPVVIKQALDMFPYVLYLDAGTTILKPVDDLFKHIKQNNYFLLDVGPWSIQVQCTKRVVHFFGLNSPERSWILGPEVHSIDAGFQGVSRALYDNYIMPLYNLTRLNFEMFVDDGTSPTGKCRHDQPLFSIYARLLGLEHLVFDTDQSDGALTMLKVDGKEIPIHITCYTPRVNQNTTIFRSRGYVANFNYYTSFIRYKE